MEATPGASDEKVAVVYASILQESTLSRGYDVGHLRSKPDGQDLCYKLGKGVHLTNWTKLPNFRGLGQLGGEHNCCRIHSPNVFAIHVVKLIESAKEVLLDDIPEASVKKILEKPSEPGARSAGVILIACQTSSSEKGRSVPS